MTGMPEQEWANMWPNSSVFILFIRRTFPQSFIEIWWTKFKIYWKRYILGPNMAYFGPKWWTCPGKNGQTCDKTHQSSFSLYEEHFLKVSSKSDEPNSRYIEKGIFWDQKWHNLGLNDGHARARMGKHVTKLISIHYLYTKKISSKFHQNLKNQILDVLKTVYFRTKYGLIWA